MWERDDVNRTFTFLSLHCHKPDWMTFPTMPNSNTGEKQLRLQWMSERGSCQREGPPDKRHFVGVRFVLSNSHSATPGQPNPPSPLIKQSLIWVPSPAPREERAACYFEESQVNKRDKRSRHTLGRKRKGGERGKDSLFSSLPLVRTAEPLWLNLNDFFPSLMSEYWNFFVSPSVGFCGCSHMLRAHPKQIKRALKAAIVPKPGLDEDCA